MYPSGRHAERVRGARGEGASAGRGGVNTLPIIPSAERRFPVAPVRCGRGDASSGGQSSGRADGFLMYERGGSLSVHKIRSREGLTWDDERRAWAGPDAFAYDGARLFSYSRGGLAPQGGA